MLKQGRCYIIGAGECSRLLLQLKDEDYVIAVDGGYEYSKEYRMDLVVGDFDSLGYIPNHPNVIKLLPEKDDTDMLVAIKEGLKAGYETFHIYGGLGGRMDHTIANIQHLAYLAERGARGYLYGDESVMTVISNGSMSFPADAAGYVSVFAYGEEAKGVDLTGLKYPLKDATLRNGYPLGVSNEFIGKEACVSVKAGKLLIVFPDSVHA